MPFWYSNYLQDSNSPIMEFLMFFHDSSMILVIMLISMLFLIYIMFMKMKFFNNFLVENQSMEDFWLIIPMVFLIFIGFPSMKNLYMYEEYNDSDINYKVIGHQWYWSYEISNFVFDSMMEKNKFMFRLLETYNYLVVPIKCKIKFLISSYDVIHSWTMPSLGIKIDAMPGRISQNITMINRSTMMFGQCSEICGANHSFMPICISSINVNNYFN